MTVVPPHLALPWVVSVVGSLAYIIWHGRRYDPSPEPTGASQQEVERAVRRVEDGDQA